MIKQTTKQKGDLLEKIVESLCSGFEQSKVTRDAKIIGKAGTERQIDVLIEAQHKSFDIKIIVEAKNYSEKVGIEKVDALKTKLTDVGGNLGVIVCPLGFTEGAINAAALHDIQLFQVFDHKLGNTAQFIPMRYVVPFIKGYSLQIQRTMGDGGTFELPTDTQQWRFHVGNEILDQEELIARAWNERKFSQKEGEQLADFGVVKISPGDGSQKVFYLELKFNILVDANFYLKLFPASFMKNIKSGKGSHQIFIDAYSKKEDMIKHGWQYFQTREEMEVAAAPHDTSEDVKGLISTEGYAIDLKPKN